MIIFMDIYKFTDEFFIDNVLEQQLLTSFLQ